MDQISYDSHVAVSWRKDKFDSFDFFGNQETESKPDSNRDVTEGQQQEETGKNRFEPVLYKQIHNLVKRV